MRRKFKRRLISKLEWLSAQADSLSTRQRVESEKSHVKLLRSQLSQSLKTTIEYPLQNPKIDLELQFSDSSQNLIAEEATSLQDSIPKVRIAILQARIAKSQLQLSTMKSGNDMKVSLEGGRKESGATDLNGLAQNYVKVGFSLELGIERSSSSQELSRSHLELKKKDLATQRLKKELLSSTAMLFSDRQSVISQLKLTKQRLVLLQQQIEEAKKQLFASRIEIEEYLRIRDRLTNEKLQQIELLQKLWISTLKMLELNLPNADSTVQQLSKMCGLTNE